MNKRERAKLKATQRDEAVRKERIAQIQAGNIQAPSTYNDPLAGRKKAIKAAPESSFELMTLKDYQDAQEEKKKDK